jgi:hypothetical protein
MPIYPCDRESIRGKHLLSSAEFGGTVGERVDFGRRSSRVGKARFQLDSDQRLEWLAPHLLASFPASSDYHHSSVPEHYQTHIHQTPPFLCSFLDHG